MSQLYCAIIFFFSFQMEITISIEVQYFSSSYILFSIRTFFSSLDITLFIVSIIHLENFYFSFQCIHLINIFDKNYDKNEILIKYSGFLDSDD